MSQSPSWIRTVVVALAVLLVGGGLLFVGDSMEADDPWRIFFFNVGSFTVASVAMALIFQFWQLRGLIDDLFKQAQISEQLRRARIVGFSSSAFYQQVPWSELFASSSDVRIVFAYGRSWRNTHVHDLERFLDKPGSRLTVVLPDPECDPVVNEMALRFEYEPAELRELIQGARQELASLGNTRPGSVEIWHLARSLTYTSYLFESRGVFTSYRHTAGRGGILTLQAQRGGELYAWLDGEWKTMLDGDQIRRA